VTRRAAHERGRVLRIAGEEVPPNSRARLEISVGRRVTGNPVVLPVEVVRGATPGPRLFVCAAIHGDEICGVEIIRRVLRQPILRRLAGALIAVPVVNVFGFTSLSRYLPDRRDLNRSFPGSATGSLASRIANTFVKEVVANSTHGIDLHTAAVHRSNLPHIRAVLDDPETERLARVFHVPVIVNATMVEGSLRQTVAGKGIPMLVYEAGEALRFDEAAIRAGVRGVLDVMRALKMLPREEPHAATHPPIVARSTTWVRAPEAGILRSKARLGTAVEKGGRLGILADPLGTQEIPILAAQTGIVLGRTEIPLVHEGDAIFNIASVDNPEHVQKWIDRAGEDLL